MIDLFQMRLLNFFVILEKDLVIYNSKFPRLFQRKPQTSISNLKWISNRAKKPNLVLPKNYCLITIS